jgi:predicted ester cyclase
MRRQGQGGQKAVAERFRAAFPDVRLEVEALVADGDLVVVRWTMSGTKIGVWGDLGPTGRPVRFPGVNFVRIVDATIAEI